MVSSPTSSSTSPPNDLLSRIHVGTYRVHHVANLQQRFDMAKQFGLHKQWDSARLYRNEKMLGTILAASGDGTGPQESSTGHDFRVTTKIFKETWPHEVAPSVEKSLRDLSGLVDRLLLHRPTLVSIWQALETCFEQRRDQIGEIGVSNYYRIQDLQVLLKHARIRPAVNQIEFHPFVDVLPILNFCRREGITVQAHSVLAQGKFFSHPKLVWLAEKHGVSVAMIMIRWAYQHGVELCLSTGNPEHMAEWLRVGSFALTEEEMAEMNAYHMDTQHRFYPLLKKPEIGIDLMEDVQQYVLEGRVLLQPIHLDRFVCEMGSRLRQDMDRLSAGGLVSETVNSLRTVSVKAIRADETMQRLMAELYNTPLVEAEENVPMMHRFVANVRALRSRLEQQKSKQGKKTFCTLHTTHPVMVKQQKKAFGTESTDGEEPHTSLDPILHPTPMPVEIADEAELKPFLLWLSQDHQPVTDTPLTFLRGTFFPDGRLDMCKQVVGPTHIESLCAAVSRSTHVRHFLMGNNIAGEGGSMVGAYSLAALMRNPRMQIETWYLAGNCFDAMSVEIMAEALQDNTHAKALWLKRNPVGSKQGAHALGTMLAVNRTLTLLDLLNTGLMDEGLAQLFAPLLLLETQTSTSSPSPGPACLRHLYLDANGLTADGIAPLVAYLQTESGLQMRSLCIAMNQLGDAGVLALTAALRGHPNLKRLALGSNACTDASIKTMVDYLLKMPCLKSLDLGTYKATGDMGLLANQFTASAVPHFRRLVQEHPTLEFLGLEAVGSVEEHLQPLVTALKPHQMMYASKLRAGTKTKGEVRFLRHPKRVVHIDSVYRGKM